RSLCFAQSTRGVAGQIDVRKVVRFSNGLVSNVAVQDVDSAAKRRLLFTGLLQSVVCHKLDVPIRHIRQRLSRGARVSAGHVGHAIMSYAFLNVNGMFVRSGPRSVGAAALIDGDVR